MYERVNQDIITIIVSEELVDLIDNEKNGGTYTGKRQLRQN